MRPWLAASGTTEYALRFPSALLGLLALPLVFVWGRRLFGLSIALLATLLMALNPYHLWYSQEAKMYALLVVVAMLAMWAFVQAIERGKWWRWDRLAASDLRRVLRSCDGRATRALTNRLAIAQPASGDGVGAAMSSPCSSSSCPTCPCVWWQWKLFADPSFSTGHRFTPLAELLQRLVQAQIQGIPPRPNALLFAAPIFLLLAALFLRNDFGWLGN